MVDNLTPEDRSWCMSQIRSRGMKPEMAVRSMVHRLGYRFRLHRRELPGQPDLVLPRHRAVIFVNGCFWHWHPDPHCPIAGLPKSNLEYWQPKLARTRIRDLENTGSLEAQGWRVLTVWECQLQSPVDVLHGIRMFLGLGEGGRRHVVDRGRGPTRSRIGAATDHPYPPSIANVALRSLFDKLEELPLVAESRTEYDGQSVMSAKETIVLALDQAIRRAAVSKWRGNRHKETGVRRAIERVLKEDALVDTVFRAVKEQHIY